MNNPTHHECSSCGYVWAHGQHGGHDCHGRLKAMIEALKDPETLLVNMMRGTIATPSVRGFSKLFGDVINGEDAQLLEIARLREELAALKQPISDEREAFEAHAKTEWPTLPLHRRDALPVDDHRHGEYVHLQHEWITWQARARLGNAVVMPARKVEPKEVWSSAPHVGCPLNREDITEARAHNAALDEVARLNPSRGVLELVGYFVQPYADRPNVVERVDDSCASDPDVFPLYRSAAPSQSDQCADGGATASVEKFESGILRDYAQHHITIDDCAGCDKATRAVPAERATGFVFVLDGVEYRLWVCELRDLLIAAKPDQREDVAVPDGVTVERDFMGTMHIKVGDFDFIQIRYQYPYTDNAGTWKLAERIAALLAGGAK